MEPVRLLRERGIEPHIYYANSNIAPTEEYEHRLETIRDWTELEGLAFTEGTYAPDDWEQTAGRVGAATDDEEKRQARCRACYRLRFEESADYAAAHGYDALGTTLSVSPYQYTDIIAEELARACEHAGIECFFEDYSPQYQEATRRSREAGMYRQNFCGCRFSQAEAEAEREERARKRAAEKAAHAEARRAKEAELDARRKERAAYDSKQTRKRAVLKALREERAEERPVDDARKPIAERAGDPQERALHEDR